MIRIFDNELLKIWFFPSNLPLMPISEEKLWKQNYLILKSINFIS